MTEVGKVVKLNGEYAVVEIGRHSACAQCGKCGMTANQKKVQFYTANTCGADTGDYVQLDIQDINTMGIATVAYLIPLVFSVLFFMVAWWLQWQDWALLVSAIVGLVIAFVVVATIDKLKKHKWAQAPTMLSILNKKEDSDE